jgi:hypothetical protein
MMDAWFKGHHHCAAVNITCSVQGILLGMWRPAAGMVPFSYGITVTVQDNRANQWIREDSLSSLKGHLNGPMHGFQLNRTEQIPFSYSTSSM